MFKSLADMKRRLVPGSTVTSLWRYDEKYGSHLIGVEREVVRTNTVDMIIRSPKKDGTMVDSHLAWPKANGIRFTDDGFAILENGAPTMTFAVRLPA